MSCHPPARQVGPYQPEDGPHDEPTEQLALADLHVKPYAKRHVKVYADSRPPYRLELVVARKVDRYCLVRLDGARYSVEPGHVGAEVAVVTRPGDPWVEIRRGARVIGHHPRAAGGQVSFDPAHGAAIEALTLASLGRAGRHRRKRNDARLGPKAAEEAAILRARAALGEDGTVQPVDLARYDQLWQQP